MPKLARWRVKPVKLGVDPRVVSHVRICLVPRAPPPSACDGIMYTTMQYVTPAFLPGVKDPCLTQTRCRSSSKCVSAAVPTCAAINLAPAAERAAGEAEPRAFLEVAFRAKRQPLRPPNIPHPADFNQSCRNTSHAGPPPCAQMRATARRRRRARERTGQRAQFLLRRQIVAEESVAVEEAYRA